MWYVFGVPNPGDTAREATSAFLMKGQLLTSFVEVLHERGRKDVVLKELGQATLDVLASNPLPSQWLSGASLAEVQCVVYDLYGPVELRECAYQGTKRSAVRFLQPFVEATMRLFGVSPEALLTRIQKFSEQSTKGMDAEYRSLSPHSGIIQFSYPRSRGLSIATLEGAAGSLKSVFDFTHTVGTIGTPRWLDESRNRGEVELSWKAK